MINLSNIIGGCMKTRIHREGLLFNWITKDYEIILGFKRMGHGHCRICGRRIPSGSNICDDCFKKEKKISNK